MKHKSTLRTISVCLASQHLSNRVLSKTILGAVLFTGLPLFFLPAQAIARKAIQALSVIPTSIPLIELPRERGVDYIHPERRIADPKSGTLWMIGLNGNVVSQSKNSALISHFLETKQIKKGQLKELLDSPPPQE